MGPSVFPRKSEGPVDLSKRGASWCAGRSSPEGLLCSTDGTRTHTLPGDNRAL